MWITLLPLTFGIVNSLQGNDEKDVSSMYLTLDYLPEEKVDTK